MESIPIGAGVEIHLNASTGLMTVRPLRSEGDTSKATPCSMCGDRGWHHETLSDDPDDPNEVYCRCPIGERLRKRTEGDTSKATPVAKASAKAGDFVRIRNGGGRGRIVRVQCVIAGDQGGHVIEDIENVSPLTGEPT